MFNSALIEWKVGNLKTHYLCHINIYIVAGMKWQTKVSVAINVACHVGANPHDLPYFATWKLIQEKNESHVDADMAYKMDCDRISSKVKAYLNKNSSFKRSIEYSRRIIGTYK